MPAPRYRTVALAIVLTLAPTLVAPPQAAGEPPVEDSPVRELATLRAADARLEARIVGLEEWLGEGQQRLAVLDRQLKQAEAAIVEAEARADAAARAAERQTEQVQDRAVAAYTHPVPDVTMPAASDVNEAAHQSLLVRQVAEYDREVLEARERAEERLARLRDEAEDARDELAETEAEVRALLDDLFARRDEAEAAKVDLEDRIEAVQAEVDAMEAAQSGLARLIKNRSAFDGEPVGALLVPVEGSLTSGFGPRWGRMHQGIDLSAPTGTPIWAAAEGVVIYSGWMSGYGNVVIVDHGGGLSTLYAHQSQRLVTVGDPLETGEVLGLVGSTGRSTGPHLHFEVRERGTAVDPIPYLAQPRGRE